ncbi:MAG: hypothetical protein DMG63_17050 [Acidobacteria bacterium]|nr:MAG: hypothetical protein DMG63_17050 [Acidobacteriota bacterium]
MSVSGALIRTSAVNDAREQNERAANKKRSDVHGNHRAMPPIVSRVAMMFEKQARKLLRHRGKASV